jgi:hypothetical protein
MQIPQLPRGISLISLVIFLLFWLSAAAVAQSAGVSVPGTAKWVDTQVDIVEGELLAITATGLWTEGDTTNGPNGIEKPWPDNFFNFADLGVCMYCARTATPPIGAR